MRTRNWVFAAALLLLFVIVAGVMLFRARVTRHEDLNRTAALRDSLYQMRKGIDSFYRDERRYPESLQALVPRYLRAIPKDPITGDTNWRLTTEETVAPSEDFTAGTTPKSRSVVIGVHSAAPGTDANGVRYSDY